MAKSPEAFRTISEVAAQLETPAHVLRFWESKFPQIRPVKRAGGRRYYRPDDIALLGGIKVLLHEQGMTIRGVQKLLRERGARHVATLSALPWEGTEPEETPEELEAAVAEAEAADEAGPAPESSPTVVEAFLAGTVAQLRAAPSEPAESGLARLRAALAAADHDALRARADRISPLVSRLEALRDRAA